MTLKLENKRKSIPKFFKEIFPVVVGIFLLFSPPIDSDLGWHLKYGEYMFQNRNFLKENVFSYTMPNYQWANSYWVAQLIMYTLFSLGGPILLSLGLSFLVVGTTFFIFRKLELKNSQIVIGIIFLFFALSYYIVSVRPMAFSVVFLLFLIATLLYREQNIKFLPLLFLVWANTHADFTLGLFILGAFNIQKLLQEGIKKENMITHLSSLACILITLINPYGILLWKTLIKEAHPLQFSKIREWLPPQGPSNLITYSGYVFLIVLALARLQKKSNRYWLIFCSAVFLALSVRISYFFRILVILGTFPFLEFLDQKEFLNKALSKIARFLNKEKVLLALQKTIFVLFAVVALLFIRNVYFALEEERWAKKAGFPYYQVQRIKRDRPTGNIFNEYNWGGYLIWKLPEYKTFIDGRMTSWRDPNGYSIFEEYLEARSNPQKLKEIQEKYNAKILILKKN